MCIWPTIYSYNYKINIIIFILCGWAGGIRDRNGAISDGFKPPRLFVRMRAMRALPEGHGQLHDMLCRVVPCRVSLPMQRKIFPCPFQLTYYYCPMQIKDLIVVPSIFCFSYQEKKKKLSHPYFDLLLQFNTIVFSFTNICYVYIDDIVNIFVTCISKMKYEMQYVM